jgi:hypothetical protein
MLDKILTPASLKAALAADRAGRNGDTMRVHATEGELFVHPDVLKANPGLAPVIFQAVSRMGADPRSIIASKRNPYGNYNPTTADQEAFLHKKIGKFFKNNQWAAPLATIASSFLPGGQYIAPLVSAGTTKLAGGSNLAALGAGAGTAIGSYFGSTSDALGGTVLPGGAEGTVLNHLAASAAADGLFSGVAQSASNALSGLGAVGSAIGGANLGSLFGMSIGGSLGASIANYISPPDVPQAITPDLRPLPIAQLPGAPVAGGIVTPQSEQPNLISADQLTPFTPSGVNLLRFLKNRNTGKYNLTPVDNSYDYRNVRRAGLGKEVSFA